MNISIKTPQTIDECLIIERLQKEIWGSSEGIAPAHLLLTISKEGGIVHLLFDGEKPIGFSYGFIATTKTGQIKLASHQAGVHPTCQGQGLGYHLKLAQREAALQKGLDLITWTYDPLQGQNANLNIRKLGAVCNTYLTNLYGEMDDGLNAGLPSDRFRVDWWIASPHVAQRINKQFANPAALAAQHPVINPAVERDGLLAPAKHPHFSEGANCCLVEVPADIARLKAKSAALAGQWRLHTRHIFQTLFARNFTATDLLRVAGRNYYLLEKNRGTG